MIKRLRFCRTVSGRKTLMGVGPSFVIAILGILGAASAGRAASTFNAATLPLEDAIKLPDQTIGSQKSADLTLPGLPAKPGKIIVLRLKMVSFAKELGGCWFNAAIQLNGAPIGRFTSGGDERMIGRPPMFELAGYEEPFPIFDNGIFRIIYAPDVEAGDRATKDGMGATLTLNISDLAGADANTLTIQNICPASTVSQPFDLIVRGIEIGWADNAALPKLPKTSNAVPVRGTISAAVSAGSIRLALGNAGGFTVARTGGPEVMVETALGMGLHAPSELLADDSLPKAGPSVTHEAFGPAGYSITAVWPKVKLVRTVEIRGDLVEWKERWTNTSSAILGIPFRHRIFLRNGEPRFFLSGDPDRTSVPCGSQNPTLYVESRDRAGCGCGVMMESDWLRLLSGLRYDQGIGEIYSENMALAPHSSCDFFLTLTPVDSGGYWTFINSVRKRWGINRTGQSAPVFVGPGTVTTEKTPEDNMRKSLGHLGPVVVMLDPEMWYGVEVGMVSQGKYPKLPPDAPRAPGACPDFDVEKFLTFQHLEESRRQFSEEVALIHKACPGVRVIGYTHPAMEVVYKPLASRWPFASEQILTAEGKPFEVADYSRPIAGKDWALYYHVPRPGSVYLDYLLARERRAMDDCGADGMYWDEFSWATTSREYSRYDYSRWDGHSADLDPQGNMIRLKCDTAWITETAQVAIMQECLLRGKFFLGNWAASLRAVNSMPVARFQERMDGYGNMANAHLSRLPLIAGNSGGWGATKTRKALFDNVKSFLSLGCIYSPFSNDNLLLEDEGPDNFVCKLYPLTIRELGPGTVTGEERLITTKTGSFDWPGRAASVRLYIYNEKGDVAGKDTVLKAEAGKPLALTVPKDGLVIAEIVP